MRRRFILASGSPRRRELLATLGIVFDGVPSTVDERSILAAMPTASPSDVVLRLSEAKAREVSSRITGDAFILGADTIVVIDGDILNKPDDPEQAVAMLMRLAGRTHQVFTGMTLMTVDDDTITAHREAFSVTDVQFAPFDETRARAYVATGEPLDKAGAYGIQAFGTLLIPRINGDYFNVVGLPLFRLGQMLEEVGMGLLG